jgi:hypothetical protein
MRGQGKIHQGRLVARRRRRIFYLCLYTVTAAGLLLSGLSYISGLQAFLITDVQVGGNNRLASSTIQATALHDLEGTYWYFFPRADVLIYPHETIRTDILALPLVKTATVGRLNMRTLAINVTERQTMALWCDIDCYSVDENGFIFAPQAPSDSGFIYKSDILTGLNDSPIGLQVLPPAQFKKIQFFMSELNKLNVEPREVSLEASSTYMTIGLTAGGKLVVNSADDLSTVLGNIQSIINDKSVAPNLAGFLNKLDYMKLDVGNKVVFKLK